MPDKFKAALLILFVAVIAYSNSLGGEFVYDDEYFITKNVNIRNLSNSVSFFSNSSTVAFAGLSEDVYRPFTTLTFAINYFFSRLNVLDYHMVNMLLHALNAILLFLFLYLLTCRLPFALFASLLFACHPVQTEAVTWISGRGNVLFLFFYLASIIFYVKFSKEKKISYYLYSVILCAVSLFSKEMAVTLPLILIVYDIHFSPKGGWKKKIMGYIPYFALTAFYLLVRSHALGRTGQCGWWGDSPYYTFLTMLVALADYIKLLVWPAKLCAFYAVHISTSVTDPRVLLSIGLLAVIAFIWFVSFKRSKRVSFAISWFFITFIPVSNIVPLKALMAERFLYLPSIGFCMLLVIFIENISRLKIKNVITSGRMISFVVLSAVTILYLSRTVARNEDWADSMTISRSIIAVSPMNPWAYHSLATAYLRMGKYAEAVKPLEKSIALASDFAPPQASLGFAYRELGQYEDSVKMLKKALSLKADNVETINSLGVTYSRMQKYTEAVKEFKDALKIDPSYTAARFNLGATYERMLDHKKAIEEYEMIRRYTNSVQDIAISYIRTGDACRRMKDEAKATEYYNKALALCNSTLEDLRAVIRGRLKGYLPK